MIELEDTVDIIYQGIPVRVEVGEDYAEWTVGATEPYLMDWMARGEVLEGESSADLRDRALGIAMGVVCLLHAYKQVPAGLTFDVAAA